jgi:peptidoglycan hydrolase CwlO-like protein
MKFIIFIIIIIFTLEWNILPVLATTVEDQQKKIDEYEAKVKLLQTQGQTLAGQIETYDGQISLAQLKIYQTEDMIASVSGRINKLESELRDRSVLLEKQIVQTYKRGKIDPIQMLFGSKGVANLMSNFKYLQVVQSQNSKFLYDSQKVQTSYVQQKALIEQSQKKLQAQKISLNNLRVERNNLLQQTKNSEANYQKLLAQARSELESIVAVLAGRGEEAKIGDVKQGDRIASLIPRASCNSNGGHLHFIVKNGDNVDNPFNYLKSVNYNNCSGSSCGSSDGDSFSPSGSWDWPLSPPITLNQGYGSTWATTHTWVGRIYSFHNGIDIVGTSLEVKAVQTGTLYRGSFLGRNCRLPYARVQHKDSNINTYYLHVN